MADERRGPRTGATRSGDRDDTGPRTRRIVILLALGVICALVLAPPLRLYVQQQQQISALEGEISERETDVAGLEAEVRLWQEDTYVAAQARERLHFVMPGEVGYVVPGPEASARPDGTVEGAGEMALARPDAAPEGTWYDRLWSSVEAAGTDTSDPVLDAPVVSGDQPGAEPGASPDPAASTAPGASPSTAPSAAPVPVPAPTPPPPPATAPVPADG